VLVYPTDASRQGLLFNLESLSTKLGKASRVLLDGCAEEKCRIAGLTSCAEELYPNVITSQRPSPCRSS
jgi:hypothetical protein